jgi:hypothetical protein
MSYGSKLLSLGVPDSRIVFDSGSSYTYFLQQAYSDLVASVSVYIYCRLNFFRNSSYIELPQILLIIDYLLMQLEEISGLGLIRDTSDQTLPICWKAEFPIRYDRKCG